MQERRLFRLAPAGYACNAYHVPGEGWRVIMRMRRADEAWSDTEPETYSHLTTAELCDVISVATFTTMMGQPNVDGEQ